MTPLLNIGDSAWWARCGQREVVRPCPVCFGKLRVTVILGNDEAISTPCDYCGKGYEGPQGVEREYEWVASVEKITIGSRSIEESGTKQTARYHAYDNYVIDDYDLFATKEEAEARCAIKSAEHAEDERQRRDWKKDHAHKSFSWHVGYHRKEVRRAKDSLAWHEARVIACQAHAKPEVIVVTKPACPF